MAQISCKTLFKVYLYIFKQRVTRKKEFYTHFLEQNEVKSILRFSQFTKTHISLSNIKVQSILFEPHNKIVELHIKTCILWRLI